MMEVWLKISYMVQLMFACFLFMIPAHKKEGFFLKVLVCSVSLILISYYIDNSSIWNQNDISGLLYWGYYIIACVLFIWIGIGGEILQSVYYAICACAVQHVAFDIYIIVEILYQKENAWINLIYIFIYIVVYGAFYLFLIRKLTEKEQLEINRKSLFPIVTIIVLVWMMSLMEVSGATGFEAGMWHRIFYRILDGLCCFYVLWVQLNQKESEGLQREIIGIHNAWNQQIKQYQITSDTIESINRKCHDLKHQIRAIKYMTDEEEKADFIKGLEADIMIYDTVLKTGNKALDTVLMEKALFCKERSIQWSCMADGSKLDFMRLEDIYAIFGNALDNSIRAAMTLENEEKKIIQIRMINHNNFINIQIQNYFNGKIVWENGMPITTKRNKNEHGYGIKSIQHTVEKYNGTVTINTKEDIFILQILLPVEEKG